MIGEFNGKKPVGLLIHQKYGCYNHKLKLEFDQFSDNSIYDSNNYLDLYKLFYL